MIRLYNVTECRGICVLFCGQYLKLLYQRDRHNQSIKKKYCLPTEAGRPIWMLLKSVVREIERRVSTQAIQLVTERDRQD